MSDLPAGWFEGPPQPQNDPLFDLSNDLPGAVITSGRRTPAGNASLPGSARNSNHLSGDAVDIIPGTSGLSPQEIYDIETKRGNRPLIESDHVHVTIPGGGIPFIGSQGSQGQGPDRVPLQKWTVGPPQKDELPEGWSAGPPTKPASTVPAAPSPYINALKLGTRDVLEGAAGLGDLFAGPVNAVVNALPGEQGLSTHPFADLAGRVSDYLGFPVSQTDAEKLASKMNEGGIQALLTGVAALPGAAAAGLQGAIARTLSDRIGLQTLANATGGGAGEEARQHGAGVVGQTAANLLGGGVVAGGGLALESKISQMAKAGATAEDIKAATGLDVSPESVAAYKKYQEGGGKEAPPVQGLDETLDSVDKNGVVNKEPVTTYTTDQLHQKLAEDAALNPGTQEGIDAKLASAAQKTERTPEGPVDNTADLERAQAEQVWADAYSKYQREHGVDDNAPIDLNSPAVQAADKAKQAYYAEKGEQIAPDRSNVVDLRQPELAMEHEMEHPSLESTPEETAAAMDTPEDRLKAALGQVSPRLEKQTTARSEEIARRLGKVGGVRETTSGEAGFAAEKAQLKGALPKVTAADIQRDFSQEDLEGLFDQIKNHPDLSWFDSLSARQGLARLMEGELPQPAQLDKLNRVFSPETIKGLIANRKEIAKAMKGQGELFRGQEYLSTGPIHPLGPEPKPPSDKFVAVKGQGDLFKPPEPPKTRGGNGGGKGPGGTDNPLLNILNLPRALMASVDLSAPLRQGLGLIHKKEFWKNLVPMIKAARNEKNFEAIQSEIAARPTYDIMKESGLGLTGKAFRLADREEAFMSDVTEHIPLVAGSERAYVGFLNKLRADTFDTLYTQMQRAGITDEKSIRDMAKFINNATGRGDLGRFSKWGPALNATFFSPRLMASRLSTLNPLYYAKLSLFARKEAVKSLLAVGTIATTVLSLAKMAGAQVETDPRSADFAKIKIGNTRYDILGGYQQYIRLGAVLASGQTKSQSGKLRSLYYGNETKKKGPYDPTIKSVVQKFFENKLAPIPHVANDFASGQDAVGQPFSARKEAASLVTPLFLQDVADLYQDKGLKGIPMSAPGIFGVGIQTYQTGKPIAGAKGWYAN